MFRMRKIILFPHFQKLISNASVHFFKRSIYYSILFDVLLGSPFNFFHKISIDTIEEVFLLYVFKNLVCLFTVKKNLNLFEHPIYPLF